MALGGQRKVMGSSSEELALVSLGGQDGIGVSSGYS